MQKFFKYSTLATVVLLNLFIVSRSYAQIEVGVDWQNIDRNQVKLMILKHDPRIVECHESGAQVHYRYETEICTRRKAWITDSCKKTVINSRTLSVDPISETYVVYSDRLGDAIPPEKSSYGTYSQAIQALSQVEGLKVNLNKKEKRKQYLSVRVRFICKGQSSALLNRLSQIVTLGIAPPEGIDSGWQDFYFNQ